MSFQYPLGLLGLLGIPILVIIYIIKSKFTEQTVSATYLWNLSERFLKKKRKDNKITGIVSLILQILAVIVISLTIAHPVLTVSGAAKEYCFVIDSSGSMNMLTSGEQTRFDVGKEEIRKIIDDSTNGSAYTLICVSGETRVLCEREKDKEAALALLDKAEAGCGDSDFSRSLAKAQEYFNENSGVLTYLITDKTVQNANNVEVISVNDGKDNYAIYDIEYEYSVLGNLTVKGKVISYESDAALELQLFVDGVASEEHRLVMNVKKGEASEFSYTAYAPGYKQACVKLLTEDSLMLDNEYIIYSVSGENSYKTLIVSQTPFFLESVLTSIGTAQITVVSPNEYLSYEEKHGKGMDGYNLYIFHSCNPKSVPRDGSVWLINTSASIENSGFGYQGEEKLDIAKTLKKTSSTSTLIRDKLLRDVEGDEIYISKYVKYDTSNRNFYTLFTFEGTPVVFTGNNVYGNRQVVFAFDLHNSDLPLLSDFVTLCKNLLDFSFPSVLDKTAYSCGEKAEINIVSGCESVRVESPSGEISHISTDSAVGELLLDDVGTYYVKVIVDGEMKTYHIYSSLPVSEQDPSVSTNEIISLYGEATDKGLDGIFDKLTVLFICLAVIFAADWVVYCYDKYQLR